MGMRLRQEAYLLACYQVKKLTIVFPGSMEDAPIAGVLLSTIGLFPDVPNCGADLEQISEATYAGLCAIARSLGLPALPQHIQDQFEDTIKPTEAL